MNINHTRDLVRMANAFYDSTNVSPEQRQSDLDHVALCTWAFVRCMKRHLSPEWEDEEAFKADIYSKLPSKQAEMIINAAHRPNRALQDLSYAIENLPMHYLRKNQIHKAVTIFEDNLGSSERILTSPVPLFYTRHLARYLSVWLLLLPLGIYDAFAGSWNHVAMIPAIILISIFLFGIEEIGTQLEEPFTVLPMQAFCDKIYNWCTEIMSWGPEDNGYIRKVTQTEHQYFTANGDTDVETQSELDGTEMNGVNNMSFTDEINGLKKINGKYYNDSAESRIGLASTVSTDDLNDYRVQMPNETPNEAEGVSDTLVNASTDNTSIANTNAQWTTNTNPPDGIVSSMPSTTSQIADMNAQWATASSGQPTANTNPPDTTASSTTFTNASIADMNAQWATASGGNTNPPDTTSTASSSTSTTSSIDATNAQWATASGGQPAANTNPPDTTPTASSTTFTNASIADMNAQWATASGGNTNPPDTTSTASSSTFTNASIADMNAQWATASGGNTNPPDTTSTASSSTSTTSSVDATNAQWATASGGQWATNTNPPDTTSTASSTTSTTSSIDATNAQWATASGGQWIAETNSIGYQSQENEVNDFDNANGAYGVNEYDSRSTVTTESSTTSSSSMEDLNAQWASASKGQQQQQIKLSNYDHN